MSGFQSATLSMSLRVLVGVKLILIALTPRLVRHPFLAQPQVPGKTRILVSIYPSVSPDSYPSNFIIPVTSTSLLT